MKLTDYDAVASLVSARARLVKELAHLDDASLTVSLTSLRQGLGHTYGDEAMAEAIRPAIRLQLEQRLKANARQLKKLGVEVDAEREIKPVSLTFDWARLNGMTGRRAGSVLYDHLFGPRG